jgi:hypothetical protein
MFDVWIVTYPGRLCERKEVVEKAASTDCADYFIRIICTIGG